MSTGTHTSSQGSSGGNGQATPHDLFALTDEQILDIEPEFEQHRATSAVISSEARNPSSSDTSNAADLLKRDSSSPAAPRNAGMEQQPAAHTGHGAQVTEHSPEPPPWLAAQMKDPWSGEEARELWRGLMQARQEAAAYRAAISTPQDARALKELYPGGLTEARAAAGRARLLEEIDGAYFGAAGHSPQEVGASRANLAQHLLREDPAAFREMVFAGLHALEEAEKRSAGTASTSGLPRLAQVFAARREDSVVAPRLSVGASSSTETSAQRGDTGFQPGIPAEAPASSLAAAAASGSAASVGAQRAAPLLSSASANEAHVAPYAAFEKAANEDLERSVGVTITRTIEHALPNLKGSNDGANVGARSVVPLQDRLSAAVRQDVESALKGDRQLGEQIAQILSARRFNNETRAQVVRLIDDRARQLVPSAAKRVINDWTQATLATHRGKSAQADTASARREVATVSGSPLALEQASAGQGTSRTRADQSRRDSAQHVSTPRSRGVDYRKLSDEQILEL